MVAVCWAAMTTPLKPITYNIIMVLLHEYTNLIVTPTQRRNVASKKQHNTASPIASQRPCFMYIAAPMPQRYMEARHRGVRMSRHMTSPYRPCWKCRPRWVWNHCHIGLGYWQVLNWYLHISHSVVFEADSHFSKQLLWTRPSVPVHSQGDIRLSLLSSVGTKQH